MLRAAARQLRLVYLSADNETRTLLAERFMADTKDKVKDAIDTGAEKAKEATDAAAQKSSEAAHKVGDKIQEAGQKIKDLGD
jgi:hypothetical protein